MPGSPLIPQSLLRRNPLIPFVGDQQDQNQVTPSPLVPQQIAQNSQIAQQDFPAPSPPPSKGPLDYTKGETDYFDKRAADEQAAERQAEMYQAQLAQEQLKANPRTVLPAGAAISQGGSITDTNPQTFAPKPNVLAKPGEALLDEKTGAVLGQNTASEPNPAGTLSIQEDENGNPVVFNNKTGQVSGLPAGIQARGTAAKADAASEKETGPVAAAADYANQYLSGGAFTGPGDEALMEKYFEVAKPTTGFRMSQPQIDLLMQARDAVQGIGARAAHALSPSAPYFDATQRRNIVKTMNDLAASKLKSAGRSAQSNSGAPPGATHIAPGSDGRKHYTNAGGADLGVVQ